MNTLLQRFAPFPFLPVELRAKGWRAAIPEARMVNVLLPLQDAYEIEEGWTQFINLTPVRIHNDTHVRSLMATCREARLEILAIYTEFNTPGFELLNNFHLDAANDVLLFPDSNLLRFFIEPRIMIPFDTFAPVSLTNIAVRFDFTTDFAAQSMSSLLAARHFLPTISHISIISTTRCQDNPMVAAFMATLDARLEAMLGAQHGISLDLAFERDI